MWLTFAALFFFSWRAPVAVAFFILFYDLYWVLKIAYLFIYLHSSFVKTKANASVDWLSRLREDFSGPRFVDEFGKVSRWEEISHLVILPMYKEPERVVRKTLESLAAANYPMEKISIVLATEESGGGEDWEVAQKIEHEFGKIFGGFLITRHPAGLPGEIPGKGSNESWAAKEAILKLVGPFGISEENVLISVFDVDTQPGPEYFGALVHAFLSAPDGARASFQPIPLYTNNFHESSMLARLIGLSSTFWQLIEQSRPDHLITFSSHSMPLGALKGVGFWEKNVVSEDSRIFFQCLNRYNGNWRVIPLHYPVYMDAVSGRNFWDSMRNVYRQQRRWGWGAENISRLMRDAFQNKALPRAKRNFWLWYLFSGLYSWASSSFIIFIFGWAPIFLGGQDFQESVVAHNLPKITSGILNLSMLGFVGLATIGFLLIQPRLRDFGIRHYLLYVLQWLLAPLIVIFLGSLPALDAQTRLMIGGRLRLGFWRTPKQ